MMEDHEPTDASKSEQPQDVPLPEPTLLSLVSGLSAQVMVSLGVFPNPMTGSRNILLNQGKHLIDTIAMLDEKTQGNQTEEEKATFSSLLHELRMIFVASQNEYKRRETEDDLAPGTTSKAEDMPGTEEE